MNYIMTTAHKATRRIAYDRKAAAEQLSISVRSLDYYISRNLIPTRMIGARRVIRHEDLHRFARGNHTGSVRGTSGPHNGPLTKKLPNEGEA